MTAHQTDVLIVGAGPAGLCAADQLGRWNIATRIVDEYPLVGGRLLGQLYKVGRRWWVGRDVAARLADDVGGHATVKLHLGQSVVGLEPRSDGWQATLSGAAGSIRAKAVVVATGSAEVPVPLPGWTLPGVLTVGAAQVMTNVYRVRPGRRGIIVGFGALAFAVAQELSWAGVDLAGVVLPMTVEPNGWLGSTEENWRRLRAYLPLAPRWVRVFSGLLSRDAVLNQAMALAPRNGIAAAGTRIRPNIAAIAIEGDNQVQGVRLTRIDRRGQAVAEPWVEPVDFVLLSGGLRPVTDLISGVGAQMRESAGGLYDVPIFGPLGQTSQTGLFVAGNALGIEAAPIAMAQGRLSAVAAARAVVGRSDGWRQEEAAFHEQAAHARRSAPLVFDPRWSQIHQDIAAQWSRVSREGDDNAIQPRVSHD